jgi:PIN domain nuclease of toxin-antitoxin system
VAYVLDASAVLAFLLKEPGQHVVADAIAAGAIVCAGNLAEVVTVLVRSHFAADESTEIVSDLPVICHDLDFDLAIRSGALFTATRTAGLSLGDRMCLALALREGIPTMTADRAWSAIGTVIGVDVKIIR